MNSGSARRYCKLLTISDTLANSDNEKCVDIAMIATKYITLTRTSRNGEVKTTFTTLEGELNEDFVVWCFADTDSLHEET
jgi:hypothetical protein